MRNLFSYKNLSSYGDLYDFDCSSVLSLIDSGDDYLISLLNGASCVELFDKNIESYNYLLFKIEAIKNLTYEEFFKYFVVSLLNNQYLEDKILRNSDIKQINIVNPKVRRDLRYNSGDVIPYLDKKTYYKLQYLLKNINYPVFYNSSIWNIGEHIATKYDILLTSCIFNDMYQKGKIRGIKNYKKLLDSFNINQIQAFYNFGFLKEDIEKEFLKRGFDIDYISNELNKDTVVSLIKR